MGGRNHRYTTPGAEGLGWPFFFGGGELSPRRFQITLLPNLLPPATQLSPSLAVRT